MRSPFLCPICTEPLEGEKSLKCKNNHCFDRAKSGYINLLGGKGGNHGDPKDMIISRKNFLDKGYYAPLAKAICEGVKRHCKAPKLILDAGCGECYYTKLLHTALKEEGKEPSFVGIDVSKDAVNYGARRFPEAELAAASVYAMPLENSSADAVLSIFAPAAISEFARVLKPEGILVMAIGGRDHLWSLKKAVYDTPYKNEPCDYALEGFELAERIGCRYDFTLETNEDIMNLFSMTPYYHKTSPKDIVKLSALESLTTEADFEVLIYRVTANNGN